METLTQNNALTVIINDSGVNEMTKDLLEIKFAPYLDMLKAWQEKAETLIVTSPDQKELMKQAREARLAVRNIRIEANNVRKELKEESNKYNKAVQDVYNLIEWAITPIEEHLLHQEQFAERYEAQRIKDLRAARIAELEPVIDFVPTSFLADMGEITEDDFQFIKESATAKKDRFDRDTLHHAEQARIAAEQREEQSRKDAAERERLHKENEELQAKLKAEKEAAEFAQRQANIAEAKVRAAATEQIKKEREERERVERELQAKKDAEADRQAAIEAELNKGDKERFNDFILELDGIKNKYAFRSKKYKTLHIACIELINKIIVYATSKN